MRLVQNWSLRRHVFGEDYWLKPTRLKDGALRPKDVTLLRTGAFVLLTPPSPQQRQVLVADFGRLQGLEEGTARQRLLFYIMVNCLNENSQRNGIDTIVFINGRGMKVKPDNGHMTQATHTKTVVCLHRIFLVRDPTDKHTTLKHLFQNMLLAMLQKFWGKNLITITEDSPKSTRQALEAFGVHPSTIPEQLGGDWGYDNVDRWLLQRFRLESSCSSPVPRGVPLCDVPTTMRDSQSEGTNTSVKEEAIEEVSTKKRKRCGSTSGQENNGEQLQVAREKSAYYSRISYYRKKEERKEMARQRDQLRVQNKNLQEEGERLKCLLDQARTWVASNMQ